MLSSWSSIYRYLYPLTTEPFLLQPQISADLEQHSRSTTLAIKPLTSQVSLDPSLHH